MPRVAIILGILCTTVAVGCADAFGQADNSEPIIDPQIIQTSPETQAEPLEEIQPPDLTKLVESWRVELASTHKVNEDRFIVMFASAREYESDLLELWLVPAGQSLPDITQKSENPEESSNDPPAAPVKRP
jgi:hypothetical protein